MISETRVERRSASQCGNYTNFGGYGHARDPVGRQECSQQCGHVEVLDHKLSELGVLKQMLRAFDCPWSCWWAILVLGCRLSCTEDMVVNLSSRVYDAGS